MISSSSSTTVHSFSRMIKMFVKDSYYEDKNVTHPNKHDEDEDEDEDENDEDELSFYDLWINSDADAWEDSSRSESQNSSFKSSEQEEDDDFEFFNQEVNPNTEPNISQPENIIFCGKIIPFKQPISDQYPKEKNHRRRGFFRWRWSFSSSHKSRTSIESHGNGAKQPCSPRSKRSKQHRGFSLRKMSIFTSPSKSRWYLYLFGITRFRSKMELREIKNRQSRRSPSFTLFRLESSNDDIKEDGNGGWGLLRALSCIGGDSPANAVRPADRCRIAEA